MWGHLITVKSLSTCWMLCGVSSARTTFFLDRHLAVFSCERHKCNWFYLHRGGGVMCAFLFFSFWDAKITSKPNPHAVCWWDVRCITTLCVPPLSSHSGSTRTLKYSWEICPLIQQEKKSSVLKISVQADSLISNSLRFVATVGFSYFLYSLETKNVLD